MSIDLSLENIEQQLYIGHAKGPCSYLDNENSSLLFLDGIPLGDVYRLMLDRGYRRHGFHLYRPDCLACQECHIIRVPIASFKMTRSQKRVWKKAQNQFRMEIVEPAFSSQKMEMYKEYLEHQHNRETDTKTRQGYQDFFVDSFLGPKTRELQIYYKDKLSAVGIFDIVGDSISAVYFYFREEIASFSPGTFNILYLIQMGQKEGLKYFYPGFYIPECRAMNYKIKFHPYQIKRSGEQIWKKMPSVL